MKLLSILLILTSCQGVAPKNLGLKDQQFSPCPDKPNCVNSYSSKDAKSYIEPIKIVSNVEKAKEKITGILDKHSSIEIKKADGTYIWAEYTSSLFKFVDDLEFFIDAENMVIQIRSASRKGYSDMGKNRQHIEEIRFKYHQNDY